MGFFNNWVRSRTAKTSTIAGTEQIHIDDAATDKKATLADAIRYTLANAYSGVSMALSGNWTLSTPQYDDLNFPIIQRSTGQTIAAYTGIDNAGLLLYPQWQVDDFHVCDSNELPHSWVEGSTISWHLHLLTNGQEAVDKFMRFELIWAIADVNEVLEERTTITTADITIPANTPSKTMLIMPLGSVSLAGYRIGAHIYPRLKRVTATGAAPAANPWIPMLQAHIQLNSLGSTQITNK